MPQFLSIDDASLQNMTLSELRTEANARYIRDRTKMSKASLIQSIVNHDVQIVAYEEAKARREEDARQREEAHRTTRNLTLRQQENPDPDDLEYPFSCLEEYDMEPKTIPGHPAEDIGDFPKNIEHYYWIHLGENDVEPWLTLCRLTNGVYVFYKGECDYTGFDCQGSMELYASKDPAVLIQMGMCESDYNKYIDETL